MRIATWIVTHIIPLSGLSLGSGALKTESGDGIIYFFTHLTAQSPPGYDQRELKRLHKIVVFLGRDVLCIWGWVLVGRVPGAIEW